MSVHVSVRMRLRRYDTLRRLDTNESGALSREQLAAGLKQMAVALKADELEQALLGPTHSPSSIAGSVP